MIITGQIQKARELLGWSPLALARKANIRVTTLNRAELLDAGITPVRAKKIQRALESAGVEFTNGNEPGVKLKAR